MTLRFPVLCLPDAPEHVAILVNPQELVGSGCRVPIGLLLVHKERVRHPDLLDVLGPDSQDVQRGQLEVRVLFLLALEDPVEGQARILPVLSEVEVEREVLNAQRMRGSSK